MTKVIFSVTREDGELYFECTGHSEYESPDTGNNDVCVAVSTVCGLLVRYILKRGYEPEICEDGHVKIVIERSSLGMNEVFRAAILEFKGLADSYPQHIKVY